MKKKIVSVLLACVLVLPLAVAQVSAATVSGKCGDNVSWSLNQSTGVLTISGTGEMWNYNNQDYTITSAPWNDFGKTIKKVVVESGVTSVGACAFYAFALEPTGDSFRNIQSVSLADSVVNIGEFAFEGCYNLSSVEISSNLKSIGEGAFFECGIRTVELPSTLLSVGARAFVGTFMTSVRIPYSVTFIGEAAFGYNYPAEGGYAPSNGFTIYGYPGTAGERYYKDMLAEYNEWKRTPGIVNGYPDNFGPNGTINFVSIRTVGGFYDVQESDWFADSVLWAVENDITNGTGNNQFSPNATCSTAQILTFLWRAAGSPEPDVPNPFSDVKSSDYYCKAAVWAYEKGLVSGSTFNGNTPCTRSATVTYLWKLSGSPTSGASTFSDVPANAPYSQAVAWAVNKGVTSGTGNNKFSPDETCTRGQIVTFLYRWKNL